MDVLRHCFINSGRWTSSYRDDVDDETLHARWLMLDRLLFGERVPAPSVGTGCVITGGVVNEGAGLLVTIWTPLTESAKDWTPLLTLGVARADGADDLWRSLHSGPNADLPIKTDPESVPESPWSAVRLFTGIGTESNGVHVRLGEIVRDLAWAWVLGWPGFIN